MIGLTRQPLIGMVAFAVASSRYAIGRSYFKPGGIAALKNLGGNVTAMYLIDLFLGVSVLSLGVILLFASHAIGLDIGAREIRKVASAIKKCTVNLVQRQEQSRGGLDVRCCFPHSPARRRNMRAEAKPT